MVEPTSAVLDHGVFQRFNALTTGDKICAEYVWIGGDGDDLRSKTKVLSKAPASVDELPVWNFDGSSTKQAPGDDSEVLIRPVKIVKDPFRGAPHILVLCETVLPSGEAHPLNSRQAAAKAFDSAPETHPWFGVEQEYTLFYFDQRTPLGWPKNGFPGPQGPYYCSSGAENAFGRRVADAHLKACLYAGLNLSGLNGEVMPGQWEYQVGPCEGIDSGDSMILSRYIMNRVCEEFGVFASFDPKPIEGDWNGAGCHTNYSTAAMREEGGYAVIIEACEKLGAKHAEHIAEYGEGNERRLTGKHETADINTFSYGVANRGASIRIPRTTEADGKGYLEDRRPASNMDPYKVTSKIFRTTVLE
jgi:glutamine synthetase